MTPGWRKESPGLDEEDVGVTEVAAGVGEGPAKVRKEDVTVGEGPAASQGGSWRRMPWRGAYRCRPWKD